MSLGRAAGYAAQQAQITRQPVQRIDIPRLQRRLHTSGAATIYISNILPGHADFAAVQWWGTQGGLHGLAPQPSKPGQRGKNIHGQYYEAYPQHAAELEKTLDASLATRWRKLADHLGVEGDLPAADGRTTRADWIRAAWVRAHASSPTDK